MSHFLVVVVGDNVDEQLKPYNEQDEEYTVTELVTELRRTSDGHFPYREMRGRIRDIVIDKGAVAIIPEDTSKWEIREMVDAGIDHFVTCDEKGHFHAFHRVFNETGKWDWYVVGGRWDGWLKGLPGAPAASGEIKAKQPSKVNGWDKPLDINGYTALPKWKVDHEAMYQTRFEELYKVWSILRDIGVLGKIRLYKDMYEEAEAALKDLDEKEKRFNHKSVGDAYLKQVDLVRANEMIKKKLGPDWWWWDIELSLILDEEALRKHARETSIPFAFVKDGRWHERAQMGWFGMAYNEMPNDQWYEEWMQMWNSLDDNTLLTVVDCHI